MKPQRPTLPLDPLRAVYLLGGIACFLLGMHLLAIFIQYATGHGHLFGMIDFFDLDQEYNAPAFFSASLFLLNGAIFLVVWLMKRDREESQWVWLFLAGLFLILTFDEFSTLHEDMIEPLRTALNTSGVLYFAWVIPYAVALVLLCLFVLPRIWQLPARIRRWFLLAAIIYGSGALGMEMVGGWYFERINEQVDLTYDLIVTVEESMEMAGLIILTYALLSLIRTTWKEVVVIPADPEENQEEE